MAVLRDRERPEPPSFRVFNTDAGDLLEHQSFGPLPNAARNDRFVLFWGDESTAEFDPAAILDGLALVWEREIEELHYLPPLHSDTHRMSVYLADSGPGTPTAGGFLGYYDRDDEGFPFLVLNPESLFSDEAILNVTSHEFFHAVQDAYGSYPYSGLAAWYWEATAEWAAAEVAPSSPYHGENVGAYLLRPDLSLSFYQYPDTPTIESYHAYGAMLWPRFLSEKIDADIVRESWENETGTDDPLRSVADALGKRGFEMDDVFGDFAIAAVNIDFEWGEQYADSRRHALSAWGVDDSLAGFLIPPGGTLRPEQVSPPQRFGYQRIEMYQPPDGSWFVGVEGDEVGSAGTPSRWRGAAIIEDMRGDVLVVPLEFASSTTGSAVVSTEYAERLSVLVAAVGLEGNVDEEFNYAVTMRPADPADEDDDAKPEEGDDDGNDSGNDNLDGLGCTGSGREMPWLGFLLLAIPRRSRRGRGSNVM